MEGKQCKCGPYAPCQEHEEHDTATVGDAAKEAAVRILGAGACSAWQGDAAAIIQSAISASERELVEALEPFAKYARARMEIFGEHSLNSYLHPQVCNGRITADIDKADWDRARAVLAKRGRKC